MRAQKEPKGKRIADSAREQPCTPATAWSLVGPLGSAVRWRPRLFERSAGWRAQARRTVLSAPLPGPGLLQPRLSESLSAEEGCAQPSEPTSWPHCRQRFSGSGRKQYAASKADPELADPRLILNRWLGSPHTPLAVRAHRTHGGEATLPHTPHFTPPAQKLTTRARVGGARRIPQGRGAGGILPAVRNTLPEVSRKSASITEKSRLEDSMKPLPIAREHVRNTLQVSTLWRRRRLTSQGVFTPRGPGLRRSPTLGSRLERSLGRLVFVEGCGGFSCLLLWPSRLPARLPAGSPWMQECGRWNGGSGRPPWPGVPGAPGVVGWWSCATGSE
ncbi:uncharacterized protein LOC128116068 [Peromyscus californicus insignis]|uniref:uncharacterized protein LOC128116068 n=1 Tax=Peromyscus californicus insignis TaxID=564181 RepID=UPI0022A7BCFC|nr:uncharacterized protein LOC128116068 [Peromyscus californicus insignis]